MATKTSKIVSWTSIGALGTSLLSFFGAPIEWLKNSQLFHPNQRVDISPADYGFAYEDVWFGGADGRLLHGWYLPGDGDAVFLWFHGNAGNIGNRLEHARLLSDQLGVGHFLFDYQGYGKSKGKPTLPGFLADSRAAITVVKEKGWASGKQLVYIGESLGCAAVVTVGLEQPPDRAILLAPFYSLRAMAERILPPLAFVVDKDLNTAGIISHFQSPLLVIHGTDDRTIPYRQGKDLFALANPLKRFHSVSGGGHTDLHLVGGDEYFRVIGEFLRDP
jgi:fermentation-respiration switch protein FrsA (DUF1100 family)